MCGIRITKVTLRNSIYIEPFDLDFDKPHPGTNCEVFKDLNIHMHGTDDLQYYFVAVACNLTVAKTCGLP